MRKANKLGVMTLLVLLVGSLFAFPLASAQGIVYADADLDKDRFVDRADMKILLGNWGVCSDTANGCMGDLNHDMKVDFSDLTGLLSAWDERNYDLNLDGSVDDKDLRLLLANWGSYEYTAKEGYKDADLNRDLSVNFSDLRMLLTAWNVKEENDVPRTPTPHPVPFDNLDVKEKKEFSANEDLPEDRPSLGQGKNGLGSVNARKKALMNSFIDNRERF